MPMKKYELFGDEFWLLPPHDDLETMPPGAVQLSVERFIETSGPML